MELNSHRPRRRIPKQLSLTLLLIAGLSLSTSRAQSGSWTPPYQMILTTERAFALLDAANRALDSVPGEVIIKFKDGVSTEGQRRALQSLRERPSVDDLRWAGPIAVLTSQQERDGHILAQQLSSQPEIEYAEPNFLYHSVTTPNDPSFSSRQWNLTAIDMPRAWDINGGGKASVTVAVVDYGVTTITQSLSFPTWDGLFLRNITVPFAVNPDLPSSRLLSGRDFAFWNGPVLDMDSHGTHVSSTIGEETNNGIAEAGIAYRATILPVKVCVGYWETQFILSSAGFRGFAPLNLGGCDDAAIALGIRYAADAGAKVINISLGGPGASLTLRDALAYAVSKGAFVAIAAGNEYESGNPVDYPAAFAKDIDGVMAVGAVGPSLRHAFYSNTGPHVEIVAPGGDDSEGGASGEIWQSTISPLDSDPRTVIFPRFDRYVEKAEEGTSMATPHVSGVAALLVSQGINSPAAVEKLIEATALDLGSPGRDDVYGYGLIQPRAALLGKGVTR